MTSGENLGASDRELEDGEFATLFPFPAVDAVTLVVMEDLADAGRMTFHREVLTSGSVVYALIAHLKKGTLFPFGAISISMIEENLTYIDAEPYHLIPEQAMGPVKASINQIAESILGVLEERRSDSQRLLARQRKSYAATATPVLDTKMLAELSGIPKPGSHTSYEEDDWAWEEVNVKNRDRLAVRAEWLQRLSLGRKLADPPGSFRHAINRKRKGDRKAGT